MRKLDQPNAAARLINCGRSCGPMRILAQWLGRLDDGGIANNSLGMPGEAGDDSGEDAFDDFRGSVVGDDLLASAGEIDQIFVVQAE